MINLCAVCGESSMVNRQDSKKPKEARIERLTWGLLVLIFAVIYLAPEATIDSLPNWLVPASCALVLLGSGMFQTVRGWRVSPVTWLGGILMLVLTILAFYVLPQNTFMLETLLVTVAVIAFGTFFGET
jgi:phosphatidylserine synthase